MGNVWDRIVEKAPKNLSEIIPSRGERRPMKYPYTFSAKLAQFPIAHHLKHAWIFKYYPLAVLLCSPIFFYLGRMANSPENKELWREIRRKELEGHHEHYDDIELE